MTKGSEIPRHLGRGVLHRVVTVPLVGYPLLLGWSNGWLPKPRGNATTVLRDGRLLQCQLSDRTQRTMYLDLFEPSETRLLRRLLGTGDTFIDVGAHIGWFTTVAARSVGAVGQVIACEPYPSNAALLTSNLVRNNCKNVRVVEAAIGSDRGTITLATAGDSGSVTALDWARDGRVEVPIVMLDDVAADLATITLVKIDVEGWEAHVLSGGTDALSRTKNVLIEINPQALRKAGVSPEKIFDLLRRAGFAKFVTVTENGFRKLCRSSVTNILATR